jgi:SAM-dependent methyltransferase
MGIFGKYAFYYNLLYGDKDYLREERFVCKIIKKYVPQAKAILDLGCGTGTHAILMAKDGYTVYGVDFSKDMLKQARASLFSLPANLRSRLKFLKGDIRSYRLNKRFDVATSLFHVMSYQPTAEDLKSSFATVDAHLKPGGIFIFDCWWGPGVLMQKPTLRVKRAEDDGLLVTRIAKPAIRKDKHVVDIHYELFIKNKKNNTLEELKERHRMRYLFKPEIESLFNGFNFKLIKYGEWLTNHRPQPNTWSAYFVGRKN